MKQPKPTRPNKAGLVVKTKIRAGFFSDIIKNGGGAQLQDLVKSTSSVDDWRVQR